MTSIPWKMATWPEGPAMRLGALRQPFEIHPLPYRTHVGQVLHAVILAKHHIGAEWRADGTVWSIMANGSKRLARRA